MLYSLLLAATAAAVSAQVTFDPATSTFVCPADQPNGAFCAGDSLSTNIIIRCKDGVGQPGNCNDNLAGYFPFGVQSSLCWQSSATSGIAACSKNCIVQGGSGTLNGTLTLPGCTPIPQSSSSAVDTTTTTTYVQPSQSYNASVTVSTDVQPSSTPEPDSTVTYIHPGSNATSTYVLPGTVTITITSTGTYTTTCVTDGITTTSTVVFTTTFCPTSSVPAPVPTPTSTSVQPSGAAGTVSPSHAPGGNGTLPATAPTAVASVPAPVTTLTSTYVQPSGTAGTVRPSYAPSGNGTLPATAPTGLATATPVGPTASPSTTGPALSNNAMSHFGTPGAGLAALCLFFVYFL